MATVRFTVTRTLALALGLAASQSPAEVPAEYREAVTRAETLGTAIYVHDSAGARATDELIDRGLLEKDKRLRGWITALPPNSDSVLVTFVGEDGGTTKALYRILVPPNAQPPHFEALKPAQPLTDTERALFAARTLAVAQLNNDKDRCAASYNSVVLPIERAGDPFILVYLLAATNEPGVVVAGGHIRYEVSPDGTHIEGQRTFTRSCMEIPPEPKDKKVAAVMLTHLLDPTPTEIHVFLSREYRRPFFIGTAENDLVWRVDGSHINLMDQQKK